MKRFRIILTVFVCVLSLSLAANSFASEGNQMKGSSMSDEKASDAIDGFCPVCIASEMYVKGNSNFSTEYKGKVYYFPGIEQQKMFLENPEKFTQDIVKKYLELKEKHQNKSMQGSGGYKGSH